MSNIVDQMPNPAPIGGFVHSSRIELVVRDGLTGEIRERTVAYNNKIYSTYSILISAIINSDATLPKSIVICGLGCSDSIQVADVSITGEIGDASARTVGNLSWDANSPAFNLSFSFTAGATYTVGTLGLFWTFTGDGLFLKTSTARTQVSNGDSLYVSWKQSFASA